MCSLVDCSNCSVVSHHTHKMFIVFRGHTRAFTHKNSCKQYFSVILLSLLRTLNYIKTFSSTSGMHVLSYTGFVFELGKEWQHAKCVFVAALHSGRARNSDRKKVSCNLADWQRKGDFLGVFECDSQMNRDIGKCVCVDMRRDLCFVCSIHPIQSDTALSVFFLINFPPPVCFLLWVSRLMCAHVHLDCFCKVCCRSRVCTT